MIELSSIKASFSKPIRVGEKVSLTWKNEDKKRVKMELLSDNLILTKIEFKWKKLEKLEFDYFKNCFPKKLQPYVVLENEIEDKSGNLDLYLNIEAASKMFPNLIECFSQLQISIILGTSRLVGTECPGLHSIYSELRLLSNGFNECTTLKYEVAKFDKRFNIVSMDLAAPGITGFIKAFVRPKPLEQDSYIKLKQEVGKNEFKGQRALVIGGSRGLGEVTAKLLAAGSAELKLTYHQGEKDAHRIVKEITLYGGTANCFQFDVLCPEQGSFHMALNNWHLTHLYYFATPFIFSGTKGLFSTNLFRKFCDYYISGFANTIEMLKHLEIKYIFYPSSVAIDELPMNMGEYVAAKIAGEMLCMFFENNYKDIITYRPRLPRMDTDQTASLFPVDNADPAPILLEHLRLFRDSSEIY